MIAEQLNKMVDTMSNMFDVLRSIITKQSDNLNVLKDKVIELEKRIKELENKWNISMMWWEDWEH